MSTTIMQPKKKGRKKIVSDGKIYSILLEKSLIQKMNEVSKIIGQGVPAIVRTSINRYCQSHLNTVHGGK